MTLDEFGHYLTSQLELESALAFSRVVAGRELHEESGKAHFHVYLYYPGKYQTKNVRAWDFELSGRNLWNEDGTIKRTSNYAHPNIKRLKNKKAVQDWIEYCKKGGEWQAHGLPAVPVTSHNYIKKRADQQAWEQDAKAQTLKGMTFISLQSTNASACGGRLVLLQLNKFNHKYLLAFFASLCPNFY